ncbi:raffinose synthase or seed imbibition protein Sip1-domain-containing protein [Cladochytrium replicatum]|nr:raffinose synthase or seed imbibition protein Sip1-domain-containing protein [Cladochytrium replicatum]
MPSLAVYPAFDSTHHVAASLELRVAVYSKDNKAVASVSYHSADNGPSGLLSPADSNLFAIPESAGGKQGSYRLYSALVPAPAHVTEIRCTTVDGETISLSSSLNGIHILKGLAPSTAAPASISDVLSIETPNSLSFVPTHSDAAPVAGFLDVSLDPSVPAAKFNNKDILGTFTLLNTEAHVAVQRDQIHWVVPSSNNFSIPDPPEEYQKAWTGRGTIQFLIAKSTAGAYTVVVPVTPVALHWTGEAGKSSLVIVPGYGQDGQNVLDTAKEAFGLSDHVATADGHARLTKATVYVASGVAAEPYEIVKQGMLAIRNRMHKSLGIEETQLPVTAPRTNVKPFYDYFSWCTWNSCYSTVSAQKILDELEVYKNLGIKISSLLIDDGWQSIEPEYQDVNWSSRLSSVEAHKAKFPNGLGALVREVKEKYGVKTVGVWHTLNGYWRGIDPNGTIAQKYKLTSTGAKWPAAVDMHLVSKEDVGRFYKDFNAYLTEQGVDYVKIDNQSFFDGIVHDSVSAGDWKAYQDAVMAGDAANLPMIWCMAHCPNLFWYAVHLRRGLPAGHAPTAHRFLYRTSDDFYPDNPASHTWHVFVNAINSIFFASLSMPDDHFDGAGRVMPDWDMFQSVHEFSRFHTVSRVLSGGPVYISDFAGSHDVDLLRSLYVLVPASEDPTDLVALTGPLRSNVPGRPSPRSLFTGPTDGASTSSLFKIYSVGGPGGAVPVGTEPTTVYTWASVGLFNCRVGTPGLDVVSPLDAPVLERGGDKYVARTFFGKQVQRVGKANGEWEEVVVALGSAEAEIVTFAPVVEVEGAEIACFGLEDKMHGTRAIAGVSMWATTPGITNLVVELTVPGNVGFYVKANGAKVSADEEYVVVSRDEWVSVEVPASKYKDGETIQVTLSVSSL